MIASCPAAAIPMQLSSVNTFFARLSANLPPHSSLGSAFRRLIATFAESLVFYVALPRLLFVLDLPPARAPRPTCACASLRRARVFTAEARGGGPVLAPRSEARLGCADLRGVRDGPRAKEHGGG
eukprot:6196609-Pleurochrysis_carterae.AAC.1